MSRANLRGAALMGSGIIDSDLTETILDGATFGGEESAIEGSNFDKASLRGATFIMASLSRTTMRGAILDGVVVDGDTGLMDIDLSGASWERSNLTELPCGWGGTIILPDGRSISRQN